MVGAPVREGAPWLRAPLQATNEGPALTEPKTGGANIASSGLAMQT